MPDLITTAKGIAGGLPLAAVTGRAEVMDSVHAGGLGGTYGGNPVACAAALGAIETMRAEDLCGRAREIEALFLGRLEQLRSKYDVIADVRGRGAMLAVELTAGAGDLTPEPDRHRRDQQHCHSQGLVTLTAGTFGNVLRFLPPLVAPDHLLDGGPRHPRGRLRPRPRLTADSPMDEHERMTRRRCWTRSRPGCSSAASGATPPTARTIDVEDPATGKTLTSVAVGHASRTARAALDAAVAAQADWAATAPRERASCCARRSS